jgi:hypothetical protein
MAKSPYSTPAREQHPVKIIQIPVPKKIPGK